MSEVRYPRRVALISLHTSPLAVPGVGDAGGLNVYVYELAKRLGERGLEVDVFTRQDSPRITGPVAINEYARVIHLPVGPAAPVEKEALPELTEEFAEGLLAQATTPYALVHSHYWLSGMAGLTVADRLGVPLVHTMHTMARVKNAARGEGQVREPDLRSDGEARIVRRATALTANTAAEATDLQRHYGAAPERVAVVPPGVDLHTFHPCDQAASRVQLGLAQDQHIVLYVGRIQPLKAPDVLIRALAELVAGQPERRLRLRLIIIGSPSGPEAAWSATLPQLAVDLGVADLVEFRPHSVRADLFRWYCAADLIGVPSHNESFGLVALEAQACGRPVVATDVGGLRHAVEDHRTGLLVHGHEPAVWAEALGSLLDDEQAREWLGSNAAVHASRFSWDNTAAATLQAYRAAVGGFRAASLSAGEPLR